MIKKLMLVSIVGIAFVLFGCKRDRELRIQLDGEIAILKVDDPHIYIFNDENIIAKITIVSNAYYVKSYAAGMPSIGTMYQKGKRSPEYVHRILNRDGLYYIINYDENGRIIEEVLVSDKGSKELGAQSENGGAISSEEE